MSRKVTVPPGKSVGREAGLLQERGPRGGMHDNYATIPEHHRAPPTTGKDSDWVRIGPTPHGHHPNK